MPIPVEKDPVEHVCAMVRSLGQSRKMVAQRLEIEPERFERYCTGTEPIPRVVILAVERLLDVRLADDIVQLIRTEHCNA